MAAENRLNFVDLGEQVAKLSIELEVAKSTIIELQGKLSSRDSELRVTKERQQVSFRRRSRRRKISSGLLSPPLNRDPIISDVNSEDVSSTQELDGYLMLTIFGYNRQGSSDFHDSDDVAYSSPTFVRMLQGKFFVLGPKGATIGSGPGCGIKIPKETSLHSYHSCITFKKDPTIGKHQFFFSKLVKSKYKTSNKNFEVIPNSEVLLMPGTIFSTGNIKWCVSPVPKHQLLLSKAFAAIREKSDTSFQNSLHDIEQWNEDIMVKMQASVTDEAKEMLKKQLLNISTEEDFNFIMCSDSPDMNKTLEFQSDFHYTETNQYNHYSLLHVAVDYGCSNIAKTLLEKGASVNLRSGAHNYTPIHLAAKHSNKDLVELLIQFNSCLNSKDSFFETPMEKTEDPKVKKILLSIQSFCAECGIGNLDEIKRLLKMEPLCLEGRGLRSLTPLQVATFYGQLDIVSFLLKNQALPNKTEPQFERTALHLACLRDQIDVARLLIEYKADKSAVDIFGYLPVHFCQSKKMFDLLRDEDQKQIPLTMAVQIGNKFLVMKLIEEFQQEMNSVPSLENLPGNIRKVSRQFAMADLGLSSILDDKDERGMSPLHIAAALGNDDLIRHLICCGANVNTMGGFEKWTPLFYAALSGKYNCVELLLSFGANREICDARGMSCIDLLEKEINTLKLRLKSTNAIEKNDVQNESLQAIIPVQYLAGNHDEHFLDISCDLSIQYRLSRLNKVLQVFQTNQQKLLKLLEDEDIDGLEELLLNQKVQINEPLSRIYPITALDYAASMGFDKIVDLLLTHNADPYISDNKSYTPIHNASDGGYHKVVRVLLNDGVDVNLQTAKQKLTPLHIAAIKNHENVLNVLLLAKDIDLTIKDQQNKNAFQHASTLSIQTLLARDDELLYLAVVNNNIEDLQQCLKTMSVNVKFVDYLSLLHVAAIKDFVDIAKLLIGSGIEINALGGKENNTALHCACASSSLNVAKLLISNGADLSIPDDYGRVPYEVTTTNNVRRLLLTPRTKPTEFSTVNESDGDEKCSICLSNDANTIVLPCKHSSVCTECVVKIEECPLDRCRIVDVVVKISQS